MRDASIETRTNNLRSTAYEAINIYGVNLSKRMYFLQYHMDDPDHVTYCATVPDNSIGKNIIELPKSRAIICYHHGSYDKLPAVRERLMEYAKNHNIPLAGTCRHIYLEGPPQHKDPNKFHMTRRDFVWSLRWQELPLPTWRELSTHESSLL